MSQDLLGPWRLSGRGGTVRLMSDVQRYLDRAAELEEVAERFGPEHRAEYRSLARSWREVAARLAAAEDDAVAA